MRAVIFGIVAFVFSVGNFALEFANVAPGSGDVGAAVAGAAGHAAAPYFIAGIFLFSKKYRNAASFFTVAAVLSFVTLIGIFGRIGPKLAEIAAQSRANNQLTRQEILEKGFAQAAKEINAKGPAMLDDDTRVDKAVAGPGARLTYFYSFPKYPSHDFDRDEFLARQQPSVKKSVCDKKKARLTLEHGGVYIFSYSGNDGVEIARFEVSKHDCGN